MSMHLRHPSWLVLRHVQNVLHMHCDSVYLGQLEWFHGQAAVGRISCHWTELSVHVLFRAIHDFRATLSPQHCPATVAGTPFFFEQFPTLPSPRMQLLAHVEGVPRGVHRYDRLMWRVRPLPPLGRRLVPLCSMGGPYPVGFSMTLGSSDATLANTLLPPFLCVCLSGSERKDLSRSIPMEHFRRRSSARVAGSNGYAPGRTRETEGGRRHRRSNVRGEPWSLKSATSGMAIVRTDASKHGAPTARGSHPLRLFRVHARVSSASGGTSPWLALHDAHASAASGRPSCGADIFDPGPFPSSGPCLSSPPSCSCFISTVRGSHPASSPPSMRMLQPCGTWTRPGFARGFSLLAEGPDRTISTVHFRHPLHGRGSSTVRWIRSDPRT